MKPSAVKKNAAALQDAIAAEAEDAAECDCGADGGGGDFASLPEAVYKASALALERRVADGGELARDR